MSELWVSRGGLAPRKIIVKKAPSTDKVEPPLARAPAWKERERSDKNISTRNIFKPAGSRPGPNPGSTPGAALALLRCVTVTPGSHSVRHAWRPCTNQCPLRRSFSHRNTPRDSPSVKQAEASRGTQNAGASGDARTHARWSRAHRWRTPLLLITLGTRGLNRHG